MHVTVSYSPSIASRSDVMNDVRSLSPAAAALRRLLDHRRRDVARAHLCAAISERQGEQPTPQPASQNVLPALAEPSWSTQPRTLSTVTACPVRMSSCTVLTSPSSE